MKLKYLLELNKTGNFTHGFSTLTQTKFMGLHYKRKYYKLPIADSVMEQIIQDKKNPTELLLRTNFNDLINDYSRTNLFHSPNPYLFFDDRFKDFMDYVTLYSAYKNTILPKFIIVFVANLPHSFVENKIRNQICIRSNDDEKTLFVPVYDKMSNKDLNLLKIRFNIKCDQIILNANRSNRVLINHLSDIKDAGLLTDDFFDATVRLDRIL